MPARAAVLCRTAVVPSIRLFSVVTGATAWAGMARASASVKRETRQGGESERAGEKERERDREREILSAFLT